jgi:hypothetical protein
MSGLDSFCYDSEKSWGMVRQETLSRLRNFRTKPIQVSPGLQMLELFLNDLRAGIYIHKLQGRKGKDEEYVKRARDFSFQLNVDYFA